MSTTQAHKHPPYAHHISTLAHSVALDAHHTGLGMYVPFHALSQLAHSWPQQGVEAQSNAYLVDSHTSVFGLPRALLATRHLATTVALQVQRWPRQCVVGAGVGAHHELVATMHEATQQAWRRYGRVWMRGREMCAHDIARVMCVHA